MNYNDMMAIKYKLGLTTRELCRLIGVSVRSFYSYKNQRNPPAHVLTLFKLLERFPNETLTMLRVIRDEEEKD